MGKPKNCVIYYLLSVHIHTHTHTHRGESFNLRCVFVSLMNLQRDSTESPFTYITIEESSPHTRNYLLCDLLSFKVYMVQVTRLCNLLCCLSHGGGWSLEEWGEHLSVDERLRPSICVYHESLHESVTETELNQSFGINRLVGWDKSGLITEMRTDQAVSLCQTFLTISVDHRFRSLWTCHSLFLVTRSFNFQLDSLGDHVCIYTRNREKSDIQHLQHLDHSSLFSFMLWLESNETINTEEQYLVMNWK
jgi:hypothetical protein